MHIEWEVTAPLPQAFVGHEEPLILACIQPSEPLRRTVTGTLEGTLA